MMAERPFNDSHRRDLLSTAFHRIGIAIYLDANGKVWVTEDFTN